MFAKQTFVSASLVLAIHGSAHAQPAATPATDPPPAEAAGPTGTFTIGAGYNTDDGFIAGAAVAQPDLFHTGRGLSLDATLSARRQTSEMHFTDPRTLGDGFVLDAALAYDRRVLPGFAREGAGTTVTLSHALGDHVKAFVAYRFEHVTAEPDDVVAARSSDPGPILRDAWIGAARTGLEYSTLDTHVLPTRGTNVGTWIEVADPSLGSDYHLLTTHSWASTHQPLGPFTLHLAGSLTSVASGDPWGVPRTERLFLDGSRDVRGYAPGALGPVGGGTFEVLGRAELEAPLVRRIGLSARAFYDAGAILDEHDGGVGHSVGFGLVWRSPVGPLTFDWAFPAGGPPRFVFGVGSVF